MTLAEAKAYVGKRVIYRVGTSEEEEGVIESVNSSYVFVRYGSDKRTQATLPRFLSVPQLCEMPLPITSGRTQQLGYRSG